MLLSGIEFMIRCRGAERRTKTRPGAWLLGTLLLLQASASARAADTVPGLTLIVPTSTGTTALEAASTASDTLDAVPVATRPSPLGMNRWTEDWSVLADPTFRRGITDDAKYIPLSHDDPYAFLSFGANLRERVESNSSPSFGVGKNPRDAYLLQRLQVHVDLHVDQHWRAFIQLEDERAFWKRTLTMVDQNPLDLRLAFVERVDHVGNSTIKLRAGRQDFAFDLQRFVSSRDGPNVRQSYDAIWADWESKPWRILGFVSQPIQYRDGQPFDDYSSPHLRFSVLRVERHFLGTNELSAYYGLYQRDHSVLLDATGRENRHVIDVRTAGLAGGASWDLEAMGQFGSIGGKRIAAWAVGSRFGYSFSTVAWAPWLGMQIDAASGDTRKGDGTIGTFNPLFPNGYYFTLAGYSTYVNVIHVKPLLTLHPTSRLAATAGLGLQWRMTTADAIYTQPNIPVANTIGRGGLWTGLYGQVRADYAFTANLAGAVEVVDYVVGKTIRNAGGRDSQYLGVEMRAAW